MWCVPEAPSLVDLTSHTSAESRDGKEQPPSFELMSSCEVSACAFIHFKLTVSMMASFMAT